MAGRPGHPGDRERVDPEAGPAPALVWPPPASDLDDIEVLDLGGDDASRAVATTRPVSGLFADDEASLRALDEAPLEHVAAVGPEEPGAWSFDVDGLAGATRIAEEGTARTRTELPGSPARTAAIALAVALFVAGAAGLGSYGVRQAHDREFDLAAARAWIDRVAAWVRPARPEPAARLSPIPSKAIQAEPRAVPQAAVEGSVGTSGTAGEPGDVLVREAAIGRFLEDEAAVEAARRAALVRRPDAPSLGSYRRAFRLQEEARALLRVGRTSAAQTATRNALDTYNGIGPAPAAPVPTTSEPAGRLGDMASSSPSAALPAPPLVPGNPPAVASVATPEEQVQAALRRYRSACNRLDAQAAAEVWPGVDALALAQAFSMLASQELVFARCDATVEGSQARAVCRGRATYVPRVGSPTPHTVSRVWAFHLREASNGWIIASVDVH